MTEFQFISYDNDTVVDAQKNICDRKPQRVNMTNLYSSDRVDKIARIMPSFTDVARTGDQVHLGLVGDPMFPEEYKNDRPMATISNIEQTESGAVVTLSHADGSTQGNQSGIVVSKSGVGIHRRCFQECLGTRAASGHACGDPHS